MPLRSPRARRTEGEPGPAGESTKSSGSFGRQLSFSRLSTFLRSPKPESSSDDLVKAENAATVVQARLRGNMARKQQEKDVGAVTAARARLRGRQSRKAVQAEEAAAKRPTRGVASQDGRPGFRTMSGKNAGASAPKVANEMNDHAAMVEAEHASTVMQAGLRGYIARNRSLREHTAPGTPSQGQHARSLDRRSCPCSLTLGAHLGATQHLRPPRLSSAAQWPLRRVPDGCPWGARGVPEGSSVALEGARGVPVGCPRVAQWLWRVPAGCRTASVRKPRPWRA